MGDKSNHRSYNFYIDRGGTFTDVYAEICGCDDGSSTRSITLKLLSEDPKNYPDAPREGIRRILEQTTGIPHPRAERLDSSRIMSIRMGTTVATNALLERKGERFGLLVTKGMRDLWKIGNQSRPKIFDLKIAAPDVLYDKVVEIDERIVLPASVRANGREAFSENPSDNHSKESTSVEGSDYTPVSVTGEEIKVEQPPDETTVKSVLQEMYDSGIRSVAVVFMHAAVYPHHELMVGKIANDVGYKQVSLSHQVMKMVKIVPRGYTTCVDAYLTPHITRYLDTFVKGFDDNLLKDVNLSFMQSDGGLASINSFSGHRAILSGPAGGVVGYSVTTYRGQLDAGIKHPRSVIGFDMGGTSTDVSRFAGGPYEHVYECTISGVTIQAPQLDINTVAAGGGSKLRYRNRMFDVGPDSVGAHPGPICYRKGGKYLAVTDANLLTGRIIPEFFPKIFGKTEDQPLDLAATKRRFVELTNEINADVHPDNRKSPEDVALGFIKVANEAMCRPIRELTQMRGFDITNHILASFGGAGGQHACAVARALGIETVFIHRYSGILSAFGIGLADLVEERQEPSAHILSNASGFQEHAVSQIETALSRLEVDAKKVLIKAGIDADHIRTVKYLNLRYQGTDCAMMTEIKKDLVDISVIETFMSTYKREFGFNLTKRDIVVDDIRVRVLGSNSTLSASTGATGKRVFDPSIPTLKNGVKSVYTGNVYFESGWVECQAFQLSDIVTYMNTDNKSDNNLEIKGPAIILDSIATILVEPFCDAVISKDGDVLIKILPSISTGDSTNTTLKIADPIQLSIFSHRFMSIAEQMGRTLQRTSVSVNIKERLDFSCALFSPTGGLVANAPHIPVHLGAMQDAVRFQMQYWGDDINPGDVFVSNHPQLAGGSHLPDITVITPVFHNDEGIVFWVASRGHHADIGGISPGSMPPNSTRLAEEGAAIVAFKLVDKGVFQEEEIVRLLTTPPSEEEFISGTRNLADNMSDLRAQVAANNQGILLVQQLIEERSLEVVHDYMEYIQKNAETAVRMMLKRFACQIDETDTTSVSVHAKDYMDNGTVIRLKVTIDKRTGGALFDFTGTGCEVYGNINAPPSVTKSAIIYSLRSMLAQDIPLNEGCLEPVTLKLEKYTLLSPSPEAAVVGGNVLTSQRVVDVILRAFNACAASQGCMNNLTFGDEKFGYYETIAGGAGAGPDWNGRSGVHTHMTNTRITDPEVLERRYPVILRQFSLRKHSGGKGLFNGGEGIVREIEFLRPLTLSILSERRVIAPYGLNGGKCGRVGENHVIRKKKEGHEHHLTQNLGGKNSVRVYGGDRIRIRTPGGGGFGEPLTKVEDEKEQYPTKRLKTS